MHGSTACACPFCRYASGEAAADTAHRPFLKLGPTDQVVHARASRNSGEAALESRAEGADRADADLEVVAVGD
jgi:hypothetical protein